MHYEAPVSAGSLAVRSVDAVVRFDAGDIHFNFYCPELSVLPRIMQVFERRELPFAHSLDERMCVVFLNVYVAPHNQTKFENAMTYLETLGFIDPSLSSQLVLDCSSAFNSLVSLDARRTLQAQNRLAFVPAPPQAAALEAHDDECGPRVKRACNNTRNQTGSFYGSSG
jgi:hypothetical protein